MSLVKEKTPALRTTQFRIQLFNPGKYKTIYRKTKKLTPPTHPPGAGQWEGCYEIPPMLLAGRVLLSRGSKGSSGLLADIGNDRTAATISPARDSKPGPFLLLYSQCKGQVIRAPYLTDWARRPQVLLGGYVVNGIYRAPDGEGSSDVERGLVGWYE